MRSLCVFCGSSDGGRSEYGDAARELGAYLAGQRIELVYGGASVGLMGTLADAALAAGGRVSGVLPRHMTDREVAHRGLSDLYITETMHERKALMAELSDGFVALPGGLGTLEELAEVTTWAQLGLHAKPIGLLNVAGFFDPLLLVLDHMIRERFVPATNRDLLLTGIRPVDLVTRLQQWTPPRLPTPATTGGLELS